MIKPPSPSEKASIQAYLEDIMGDLGPGGLEFTRDDEWKPALKAILKKMDNPVRICVEEGPYLLLHDRTLKLFPSNRRKKARAISVF